MLPVARRPAEGPEGLPTVLRHQLHGAVKIAAADHQVEVHQETSVNRRPQDLMRRVSAPASRSAFHTTVAIVS